MIAIGVDPHITKDYAISIVSDTAGVNVIQTSDFEHIAGLFFSVSEKDCTVYIEDQFSGVNIKTTKELARSGGRIEGLCLYLGIKVEYVPVSTWQAYFLIPKKPRRNKNNPELVIPSYYQWKKIHRQYLIDTAQKYTSIELFNDDQASAILIGLYGYNKIKKNTLHNIK